MKTRILGFLAIATIAIASLASCGKYEEGPGFSLRSKKARLTGEWELKKLTIDGTETTAFDVTIEFKKDEKFTETFTFDGETDTDNGEWEFASDKENVKLTYADGETMEYEIIRLTNKEFWAKVTDEDQGTTTVTEIEWEKK